MDVGLLTLGDLITDPLTGARRTHAERHRNVVDQAVLAEQVGFTSFHVGEHHFCDYILSSPPVVLAAIAERTTTLRLSTGVTLGVNLDPVRLAEDYATVDVLSGGRVEPCIGRGTFFPHTFAGFGQDPRNARAMFAEHLELLLALWSRRGGPMERLVPQRRSTGYPTYAAARCSGRARRSGSAPVRRRHRSSWPPASDCG